MFLVAGAGAVALAACDHAPPAEVECLVVTADSTFWVTSDHGVVHARGVPMLVARIEGRFKELYVADDDRSFYNAVFVGYRLFARDLARGDSVELRRDTTVARLAADYAAAHPDEEPLQPDEPENDNAAIRATSDLEILGVHGPYLSFEHHTDVDARDETLSEHVHEYRRGVLDARTGAPQTIASLFGADAADTMTVGARREWRDMRDTVLAAAGRSGASRARRSIDEFAFDASSFSIGSRGPNAMVTFAVPASGRDPDLDPVELSPRAVAAPAWWPLAAAELSVAAGEGGTWVRGIDTLRARVERGSRTWTIALRHGAADETSVVRVASAVERVLWLEPGLARDARAALVRAFAEAGDYDGDRQIAALDPSRAPLHLASHERRPRATGPRVRPRDVRPDDAAGREHPRPRVRRRDHGDARQDGGRLRDASRPQAVRHGIG
ncbi:MAG TPA: hypothetical protein VG916_00045 [Gemmatimonadaceae bacterium]|nr:hypothetical protein [Gemmatimonadaceae bacterium]